MKTKQIFRNLLLGGLLVTTFVGFQSMKELQAKAAASSKVEVVNHWYEASCPPGATGKTCAWLPSSATPLCPTGWQNNPNYQCTWY